MFFNKLKIVILPIIFMLLSNQSIAECISVKKTQHDKVGELQNNGSCYKKEKWGEYIFNGESKGKLIQSFAFNKYEKQWIAAVSINRKPETIELWKFSNKPPFKVLSGPVTSQKFAHPQDISSSVSGQKIVYWLPNKEKNGIISFSLDVTNGFLEMTNQKEYIIFQEPVNELTATVSYDNINLVLLSKKERNSKLLITIFDLKKLTQTGEVANSLLYKWPINDEQQNKKQWRQGLAANDNRIFILSGNHSPKQSKLLYEYDNNGKILAKINISPDMNFNSKTFEPEGLEIVKRHNKLYLVYGIATGFKGNRVLHLNAIFLGENN